MAKLAKPAVSVSSPQPAPPPSGGARPADLSRKYAWWFIGVFSALVLILGARSWIESTLVESDGRKTAPVGQVGQVVLAANTAKEKWPRYTLEPRGTANDTRTFPFFPHLIPVFSGHGFEIHCVYGTDLDHLRDTTSPESDHCPNMDGTTPLFEVHLVNQLSEKNYPFSAYEEIK